MPASLVGSNLFPFADGDLGHVVTLGAPSAGDIDIILVTSVTVIQSVTGFGTVLGGHLDSDDVQLYARVCNGTEGATFTVDTNGNFNTQVAWQRWRGCSGIDKFALAVQDGVATNSTPAVSSGTLAASGEVAVALASFTQTFGAAQAGTIPGYTIDKDAHLGSATFGCWAVSAYKTGAGTAAETPTLTFSGDAIPNRHMAVVTLLVSSAETVAVGGSTPAPSGALSAGDTPTVAVAGATPAPGGTLSVAPPGTAAVGGATPAPGGHLSVYAPSAVGPTQAATDLAGWFTQTVLVERFLGQTGYGPTWAPPAGAVAFVDQGSKLVRAPNGDQVVSSTRVYLPSTTDPIPLGSRVTLPAAYGGARAAVIVTALHLAPGLPVPDHLEVALE